MKKIISVLWIIIPLIVLVVWILVSILNVFGNDKAITILSHPTQLGVSNSINNEIEIKIRPQEKNLGIVSTELIPKNIKEKDTTTFKLYKAGFKKPIYQKKYSNRLILSTNPFPFGFTPIKDSNNSSYIVKITPSGNGSYEVNQVYLKYQFDKKELMSNKSLLASFMAKKLVFASIYINFLPMILISVILAFALYYLKKSNMVLTRLIKKTSISTKIIVILIIGFLIRLYLATGPYNFDIVQWIQIGSVAREHVNIYQFNQFYNYSPLWFIVLGILDRLTLILQVLKFEFVIRFFLSIIDIFIFFIILRIAKLRKLAPIKTASLFYLNPISIIISGHHGQFDNVAILLFLLGVYCSEKNKLVSNLKERIVFIFLTASLLFKHVVVFQVLYYFVNFAKTKKRGIILFAFTCIIFLATLLPFVSSSAGQILKRVFLYGGVQGLYGFTYFLGNLCQSCSIGPLTIQILYKLLFLGSYLAFVLFLKHKDLLRGTLLTILFFLVFTSGIGAQYFLLPIAFAVFFPTRWFYLYTIATTLFFLGSADELNIYTFKVFEWNTVWLFTILWFLAEFAIVFKPLGRLRRVL